VPASIVLVPIFLVDGDNWLKGSADTDVMADRTSGPPSSIPGQANLFAKTAYRVLRRLGAGGMGEVFLVEHLEIGRKLVAKVLLPELAHRPQAVDRMRLEAQALGRLNHPNIVSVTDFGTTADGRPFFVTEFLEGRTVAAEIEESGILLASDAVRWTCELLAALSTAHAMGLVHRDIKPDNLFLARNESGARVLKVLDFGIARVLPDAPSVAPLPLSFPTTTGAVIGTPRFASPEAAAGKHVDARADLYGAALVLYTMLAGRGPFDHLHGDKELLEAQRIEPPDPPSTFAREPVPAELDKIVQKALAKAPEGRFQTAREFQRELERVRDLLERPVGWLETTTFEPASARVLGANGTSATARGKSQPGSGTSSLRTPALSLRVSALVFLVVVIVSGVIAAGIVAALRAAR
jgi:serine/threonine protein kinase